MKMRSVVIISACAMMLPLPASAQLSTREASQVLPRLEVEQAAFVPSTSLLFVTARDTLFVHDRARSVTTTVAAGVFDQLTVSPAGNAIAFVRGAEATGPRAVWVWSVAFDGSLRGSPTRVSAGAGLTPQFAPDGNTLAFVSRPSNMGSELRVVSVNGRGERVLANFPGTIFPFWTADGQTLFVRHQETGSAPVVIRNVAVSGAAGAFTDTLLDAARVLYSDGSTTIYRQRVPPGRESHLVWKTGGDKRVIQLPSGSFLGEWNAPEMRVPVVVNEFLVSSAILDVATGRSEPLQVGNASIRAPRWSSDGRLIAAQTLEPNGRYAVTVFDVARATWRTYSVPPALINVQTAWSPASHRVAVRTMEELWTLDLRTGNARRLGPAQHPHHIIWRDDSTVATSRIINWPDGSPRHLQLFESVVSGTERLVRDVNADFPGADPLGYFSTPDAYVLLNPRRIVVKPLGGADSLPGDGPRIGAPGHTNDGRWLLLGVGQGGRPSRQLELIDVERRTSRLFDLPFDVRTAGFSRPALMPDHRSAIVLGRSSASQPWAFYRVSFEAESVRTLTTIPGDPRPYHFDLSPDGRRLAYSFENHARAVITTIDLRQR